MKLLVQNAVNYLISIAISILGILGLWVFWPWVFWAWVIWDIGYFGFGYFGTLGILGLGILSRHPLKILNDPLVPLTVRLNFDPLALTSISIISHHDLRKTDTQKTRHEASWGRKTSATLQGVHLAFIETLGF